MQTTLKIIPLILYLIVGLISLVMAWKSLASKEFIPFHEEAAGMPLGKLEQRVQNVIIALMRTTGLGFLAVGLLLVGFPVVIYFKPDSSMMLVIPLIAAIYCIGLFLVNYQLHKKANVETPWIGSLIAAIVIVAGMVISML
jgi:hypothetical protein